MSKTKKNIFLVVSSTTVTFVGGIVGFMIGFMAPNFGDYNYEIAATIGFFIGMFISAVIYLYFMVGRK